MAWQLLSWALLFDSYKDLTSHGSKYRNWRALHDHLPTRQLLMKWMNQISTVYPLCRLKDESLDHLLCHYCAFTRRVWELIPSDVKSRCSCTYFSPWFWHDTLPNHRCLVMSVWFFRKVQNYAYLLKFVSLFLSIRQTGDFHHPQGGTSWVSMDLSTHLLKPQECAASSETPMAN